MKVYVVYYEEALTNELDVDSVWTNEADAIKREEHTGCGYAVFILDKERGGTRVCY